MKKILNSIILTVSTSLMGVLAHKIGNIILLKKNLLPSSSSYLLSTSFFELLLLSFVFSVSIVFGFLIFSLLLKKQIAIFGKITIAISIALLVFFIFAKTTFGFSVSDPNDIKNLIVTIVIAISCVLFESFFLKVFPKNNTNSDFLR